MLNFLWGGMLVVGIIYGGFCGRLDEVTNAVLESSREAVNLCISMIGIMAFWMGIMEVSTRAGILQQIMKLIYPVARVLFPKIPKGHRAFEFITTNIVANMLGLGWAATPAGLQAMKSLEELEDERRKKLHMEARPKGEASNEMCTFLILNISSLQLIPVNIIAYRSQYGSTNPTGIIGKGLLATSISTLSAVVFCIILQRKRNHTL